MQTHTKLAKTIHWTFSILYAYGILKQVEDLDELEDPSLLNFEIFFAVIFLVIVMLRFFYMKDAKTLLGAHDEMHKGHLFIAKATHRLVYFSLIMLPATGLLIAALHNAGLATLTHTPSPMKFLNEIFDRPVSEKPLMLVVTGYPSEGVKVPSIKRKSLEQISSFH